MNAMNNFSVCLFFHSQMLVEAALGDMYERTHAEFVTTLPHGKHSTFGKGKTHPNPKKDITLDDGVVVPLGEGVSSKVTNSSLLYNEYIVYNTSQVRIRYLLRVNFKFKGRY
eukprot:m.140390 g.140390  ORF g.140390 m.140390 type:complete len:112 (-) comp13180_c2_seq7:97-432(-)